MFLGDFWDVSLNGDLIEISKRHLMTVGNIHNLLKYYLDKKVNTEAAAHKCSLENIF